MKYYRLLGEYNAETTTFSAFAGGAGASPYTPSESARLTGLRVFVNRAAATTLVNGIVIRMTSNTFKPNMIEAGVVGGGLQTAPIAAVPYADFDVNQEVQAGVPITLEAKNVSETDTPVAVSILVFGRFEN